MADMRPPIVHPFESASRRCYKVLRLNEMSDFGEPLGAPYVYFLRGQMGKLSEFVSKGVRLIVVDPEAPATEAHAAETSAPAPARGPHPREIPLEEIDSPPPPPSRSEVAMETEDFGAVYDEAGVGIPDHGYGVDKVAEMLQGKRLSSLARDVRATAVLAALEAAQVDVKDVIADAVKHAYLSSLFYRRLQLRAKQKIPGTEKD